MYRTVKLLTNSSNRPEVYSIKWWTMRDIKKLQEKFKKCVKNIKKTDPILSMTNQGLLKLKKATKNIRSNFENKKYWLRLKGCFEINEK